MSPTDNETPKSEKKQLRERKKEMTKEVILSTAQDFYFNKPMNEVTLEEIAEAALISRTTIYNYFKNKDDVFFAVGNKIFKELNDNIESTIPNGLSGKDQVFHLCEMAFNNGRDNPIILKISIEFYNRLISLDLSAEEIYNNLSEKFKLKIDRHIRI